MFEEKRNDRGGFAPRPLVKGNWRCSKCSKDITELPFEPDISRPIYCRECNRDRKIFGVK